MSDGTQHRSSEIEREYFAKRHSVMLEQENARMRVQQTLRVSHQNEGGRSVPISRETLMSLIEFERTGNPAVLTKGARDVLEFLDIWTEGNFAIGSETEFYIHLYNSVEAELFDEAAALEMAVA